MAATDWDEDQVIQKSEIRKYIKENFKDRKCSQFVHDTEREQQEQDQQQKLGTRDYRICMCGRMRYQHIDFGKKVQEGVGPYNIDTHTSAIPASCFGAVSFYDFGDDGNQMDAPYLRVGSIGKPSESYCKSVWMLLYEKWKMRHPKLLLSVIGNNPEVTETTKQSFQRALINAATKTDGWIVTLGMGAQGVADIVGEAIQDYRHTIQDKERKPITALGIGKWGILNNWKSLSAHNLKNPDLEGNFSTEYIKEISHNRNTDALGITKTRYVLDDKKDVSPEQLDANHTHFLLVDDDISVPRVLIVLGGGVNILKTVHQALEDNVPVVVKASGGVAALIARVHAYKGMITEERQQSKPEDIAKEYESFVSRLTEKLFTQQIDEPQLQDVLESLKEIFSPKLSQKLTVLYDSREHTTSAIENAILSAVLKDMDIAKKMKLLLAWDHPELAREQVLNNKQYIMGVVYRRSLLTALQQGKTKFVELLLRQKGPTPNNPGSNPEEMGTDRDLLNELYYKEKLGLQEVGEKIEEFMGQHVEKLYKDNESTENVESLERELFFWAILSNHRQIVECLWRIGKDHIGAALIASSIIHERYKEARANGELDIAQALKKSRKEMEQIAVGVLSECYHKNAEMSRDLLRREIPTWGNNTLFAMAESHKYMDFMEHACCQTQLRRIWMGNMAPDTGFLKIIVCIFLPFLCWITEGNTSTQKRQGKFKEWSNEQATEQEKMDMLEQCKDRQRLGRCCSVKNFYETPITKFVLSLMIHLLLAVLCSIVILTDLDPTKKSLAECTVWYLDVCLFTGEILQLLNQDRKDFTSKLMRHFEDGWNWFDIMIHISLWLCVGFRLGGADIVWTRTAYSITNTMYYLRLLQFFLAVMDLGPKIIMIREMLKDLLFFMAILGIVMLAYGVAVHALLFPNTPLSFSLLKDIFYRPYWHIYGELFLEQLEGSEEDCSDDERIWQNVTYGIPRCPQRNIAVILLSAVYMIITNLLLVNLLIAMFSNTFTKVQEQSGKVWHFHFYSLVREYHNKPTLPAPLFIISLLHNMFLRYCIRRSNPVLDTVFSEKFEESKNQELTNLERSGMEEYVKQNPGALTDTIEKPLTASEEENRMTKDALTAISKQLNEVEGKLSIIQEQADNITTAMKAQQSAIERLESTEENMHGPTRFHSIDK